MFSRFADFLVDHSGHTWIFVLLVTGIAIVGYVDPDLFERLLQPRPSHEVAREGGSAESLPDVEAVDVTGGDAVLVAVSDAFFTPQGAAAIRAVVDALEQLDYVDSVMWMDRVPVLNIFGLPEPLLPKSDASPAQFQDARAKALAHPLVRGQLLSDDAHTMLLMVRFDFLYVASDDDCTVRLRQAAERAAAAFPEVPMSFMVTGRVPMYVAAVTTHEANQVKYQLIGYGMIAVMSVVLFRGLTAVLIVASAPALGVFWTMGILRFFDLQDNPFNDVVLPVLLSLVALTGGVHLMVNIRQLRAEGLAAREAARGGLRDVGAACALTSLTTAIGFGSLGLAHHEVVREFGLSCVIGVGIVFVAVITTIPLACATRLGRVVHSGHGRGMIERNLARIGGLVDHVLTYRRSVSAAAILVTALLGALCLTLRPDERNANALPEGSEVVRALRHLDQALGGLESSEVAVSWSAQVDPSSGELLDVLRKIDQLLGDEPLIGHPLSIHNLVAALPGEGTSAERMPMIELLPPPLKRAYYVPEKRRATVSFRVQDLGIAAYGPVFQRIQQGLRVIEWQHPEFKLSLTGRAVWRWENLYQIVVDLATSLGTASLIIFAVLGIAYRSFRIGLISIIPNMFPLAVTGAYLVVTGQALEMVSVCAFTICLGIAVDDTIHFLTRYRHELRDGVDEREVIRRAFTGVGTGMIMTTMVLVAGFMTVIFSDLRDHRIFATMGTLTLTAALFGDMVLLPALLACFGERMPAREHEVVAAAPLEQEIMP